MEIEKNEYLEAVMLGVKGAFLEMMEADDTIRTEQVMEQIRLGVHDAIWRVATNATSMPCADFYDHIYKGVKEAMELKDIQCCCEKEGE